MHGVLQRETVHKTVMLNISEIIYIYIHYLKDHFDGYVCISL